MRLGWDFHLRERLLIYQRISSLQEQQQNLVVTVSNISDDYLDWATMVDKPNRVFQISDQNKKISRKEIWSSIIYHNRLS